MRLRTVSCQEPGWTRVRHGRGFRYLDEHGEPLTPEDRERIRELVIPPAWTEVWICPHPRGHLQAVGTDDAGRRQYLYHPAWREQRDLEKFDRALLLAERLPGLRRKLRNRLRAEAGDAKVERDRELAAAVRLVDLGCFRPGSEESAEEFGSHGLTTLERRHVRREEDALVFRFVGKAGIEHEIRIDDADLVRVLQRLRGRRSRDGRLLRVTPEELNEYVRALTGLEVTAKDFRTWHATVTAAVSLAGAEPAHSATARRKRVVAAVTTVAEMLGNTPAVARSSYIDPRIIDLYEAGTVLDPVPSGPDAVDRAVARLLASSS